MTGGLAGVLACYLAALGYGAAQSPVPDSMQAVIPWLEAHHLTNGLGTYAESNLITMDSGGRLAIRDVAWRSAGDASAPLRDQVVLGRPPAQLRQLHPDQQRRPLGHDGGANRLVCLIPRSAIAALHAGPPAHVYHYKTFTIMVWNHNLLTTWAGPRNPARRDSLH